MADAIDLLLDSRDGSAFWDWTAPKGNDDGIKTPALLIKVGRGEANGRAIGAGPKVAYRSKVSVIQKGPVAVVVNLFRLGDYPKPFRVFIDHHSVDQPTPLPHWQTAKKIVIHVFERNRLPSRSIAVANEGDDWTPIIRALKPFPRWTPEQFAEEAERLAIEDTPQDLWRKLQLSGGSGPMPSDRMVARSDRDAKIQVAVLDPKAALQDPVIFGPAMLEHLQPYIPVIRATYWNGVSKGGYRDPFVFVIHNQSKYARENNLQGGRVLQFNSVTREGAVKMGLIDDPGHPALPPAYEILLATADRIEQHVAVDGTLSGLLDMLHFHPERRAELTEGNPAVVKLLDDHPELIEKPWLFNHGVRAA